MKLRSNLHTHTVFCDGKDTPEEMVQAAVDQGLASIGFSGHSFTPCDMSYCMLPDSTAAYRAEVLRLKEAYKDKIEVYLGTERDYYTDQAMYDDAYDYILGSVHYVLKDRQCLAVDHSSIIQEDAVRDLYAGSWLGLIRDYYDLTVKMSARVKPDIIGHFDVITKFNEGGRLFDEESPAYRHIALEAMDAILPNCRLFEMNTGAIARKKRTTPYIAPFLLHHLREKGGEIVINSDCHDRRFLQCAFDDAAEMAKAAGFTHAKILLGGKFVDTEL